MNETKQEINSIFMHNNYGKTKKSSSKDRSKSHRGK